MDPIPIVLPSRVEETLAPCPRFRILVAGRSGVGKSSLVSCVFGLKLNEIDIAHHRAGNANIDYEYTSSENPRLILHDSQGFDHWETVEGFLCHKNSTNATLNERVHAIWLCIPTPRTGSRLLETGDENLLTLADDLNIPVILVFTKFDLLINEHFQHLAHCEREERKQKAQTQAQAGFEQAETEVRHSHRQVRCVKVSTHVKHRQRNETLKNLTNTTREILHDVEGELWVPWAAAQQVNARQKVDTSIEEGFKEYWDLGRSTIFSGHKMVECIWRIHDGILKVWNFNDPGKLLAGPKFFEAMVLLVNFVVEQPDLQNNRGTSPAPAMAPSDLLSFGKDIGPILAELFPGAGFGISLAKLLYGLYEKIPLASQYLGAYIVDLTIILHDLFSFTLPKEPPRELTQELIDEALNDYKQRSAAIHRRICTFTPVDFPTKIKELIYEELGFTLELRRTEEGKRRHQEEGIDADGWGEWQGAIEPTEENIQLGGARESESDDRKEEEFEAKAEADVAKPEDKKAEVEEWRDDCEANMGDRHSKELEEPKEVPVVVDEDIEKIGQRQENEKSCWATPLQNRPAIIVPKQKESHSFCCGCVIT